MPLITVFTPTYNRARLLPRLFDSLCRQTFTDFEWLIVDDGSTDGTEELVRSEFLPHATPFPVRYIRKENGGKHTAINVGTGMAKGELFFIADSDDMLPADSLLNVAGYWSSISKDDSFAGVCGLDEYTDHRLIGPGLPADFIEATSIEVRFRMGIEGDMKEVFRTSVLREFPFPEISGERFCPEMLVWNRIAARYKLRYFNRAIYTVEYQPTGITSNIVRARMQSPVASMMTYQELTEYDVPMCVKVRSAINYWRFRLCYHKSRSAAKCIPHLAAAWNILAPVGWLMHLKDLLAK